MSFQADAFQNDAFQVQFSYSVQGETVALLDSQSAVAFPTQTVADTIAIADSQSAISFPEQAQSEQAVIADNQSAILTARVSQAEVIAFRLVVDVEDFASAPLTYGSDAITGLPDRFSYIIQAVNDVSVPTLIPVKNLISENIGVSDVISANVIESLFRDKHDGLVRGPYPKKHKYDLIAPELHRKAKLRKDLITALQDGSYLPDLLGASNKTVQIQRPHPPELPQLSSPPVQVGDLSRVIVSLRQSPNDDEEAMEALLRVL